MKEVKYIHVKVSVGMKKESFKQKSNDHFEISVKQKAERNLANVRIIELLALFFRTSQNKIRIINGHRSPSKLLVVEE